MSDNLTTEQEYKLESLLNAINNKDLQDAAFEKALEYFPKGMCLSLKHDKQPLILEGVSPNTIDKSKKLVFTSTKWVKE